MRACVRAIETREHEGSRCSSQKLAAESVSWFQTQAPPSQYSPLALLLSYPPALLRHTPPHVPGVFVGLRHNVPPFQPSSGGSGGSSKQRPHTWSALAMTPAASALAAAALAPASVPLACCTISGASSPLTIASAAATRRASSFSEIAPEDDCERQPSGLLIGGLSQAQRASGGVGGSGNVGLLQWAEEEEGVDVRGGGGGGRGGGTVGSSLDESVRASHDGRGRNPMAPADVMAAFQHWVPRHCGHGVHHVVSFLAGLHVTREFTVYVRVGAWRGAVVYFWNASDCSLLALSCGSW